MYSKNENKRGNNIRVKNRMENKNIGREGERQREREAEKERERERERETKTLTEKKIETQRRLNDYEKDTFMREGHLYKNTTKKKV